MNYSDFEKKDNKDKIASLIQKIVKFQKPSGVLDIDVSVDPISDKEYYVSLTFLVPEDSDLLKRPRNFRDNFYRDDKLIGMKEIIRKSIEDYLSIKVYINQYGIRRSEK